MSNVRPWFRLSSIARPTSQASSDPPPPPQPRQTSRGPVLAKTQLRQPSPPRQQQPPSPPRQPSPPPRQQQPPSRPRQPSPPPRQQQPPSSQERSPYHSPPSRHMSPPSRHMSPPTPLKATSPSPSPSPSPPPPRLSYTPPPHLKEVQEALPPRKPTSPQSPAHSIRSVKHESETSRKVASPRVLSPYSLPPPQFHSERETTHKLILTAEKSLLHEPNLHNHNQNHNQNQNQNQNHNNNHQGNNTKKTQRQPPFSDNIMSTRVITIAGENKGAIMEILRSPSSNKTGGTGTHPSRGFHGTGEKGRRLQSSSSSSSDEGEGKKKTTKNNNNNANNSNFPMKAFMNSNVQMINNSIVYNSTATHHDPGVHLKISPRPGSDNGFHVKDYGNNKGGGYTN